MPVHVLEAVEQVFDCGARRLRNVDVKETMSLVDRQVGVPNGCDPGGRAEPQASVVRRSEATGADRSPIADPAKLRSATHDAGGRVDVKIVAILCLRNGEPYLRRCLEHLQSQGVQVYLMDNGSTDGSAAIANEFLDRNVIAVEPVPFDGVFRLSDILRRKQEIVTEVGADWFLHHDVDEIRESPMPGQTLADAIAAVDAEGYNAVDFDEFVFLPVDDEDFEGRDFVAEMRHYYHFRPREFHRVNVWKNVGEVDLLSGFGHQVQFPDQRVYPTHFVLRHYIALSRRHLMLKFAARIHGAERIERTSWDDPRVAFTPSAARLPDRHQLTEYADHGWDRSNTKNRHLFLAAAAADSVDHLRRAVDPSAIASRPDSLAGDDRSALADPVPVLVGVPGSGVSLLGHLLGSHPMLAIPAKTRFLPAVLALHGDPESVRQRFIEVVADPLGVTEPTIAESVLRDRLSRLDPFDLRAAIETVYALLTERQAKPRWGDQTPGTTAHLRQISAALPTARIVHVIRDGRQVAAWQRANHSAPTGGIDAAAIDWVWHIREARQQAQVCPHYFEVRYENLVNRTTEELATICDFLDLPATELPPVDPAMLDQLRLDSQSSHDLTPDELDRYEYFARDLLGSLGYECT